MTAPTTAAVVVAIAVVLGGPAAFGREQDSEPRRDGRRHETPPRATDPEMHERMFGYFEKRLRVDLELSDDQVAKIVPRVRQMERERRAMTQEKRRAMTDLRGAYRDRAADDKLQSLLDRVEAIDGRMRARMRALMGEMDRSLSVRQRVEFRSFLQQFRREMHDRVEQMRRDSGGRMQRRPSPRGSRPDPSQPRPP